MHETRETLLKRLEAEARQIRRNVWRALRAGGSGHAGGSSSAADILAALYFHRLRVRPSEPDWPERDRFVLSKGHANAALGAVLAQAGFIDDAVLDRFYGFESPFGMHPDIKVAGVEMCTGALGHGLAVAMGMALGARIQKKAFHTFVMLGDGELHEGSNWEAAMAGGALPARQPHGHRRPQQDLAERPRSPRSSASSLSPTSGAPSAGRCARSTATTWTGGRCARRAAASIRTAPRRSSPTPSRARA